jgi:hypothetical protein
MNLGQLKVERSYFEKAARVMDKGARLEPKSGVPDLQQKIALCKEISRRWDEYKETFG